MNAFEVHRALVLIIGISQFDDKSMYLRGVIDNVKQLRDLWKYYYNYDVFVCNERSLYSTERDIISFIDKHKRKLETNIYQCVIVHVLSHGSYNDAFLSSDQKRVPLTFIRYELTEAAEYMTDPLIKLIFVHTCRMRDDAYIDNTRRLTRGMYGDYSTAIDNDAVCNNGSDSNWAIIYGNTEYRTLSDAGDFTHCIYDAFEKNTAKIIKQDFRTLMTEIGANLETKTNHAEICNVSETLRYRNIRLEPCKQSKYDENMKLEYVNTSIDDIMDNHYAKQYMKISAKDSEEEKYAANVVKSEYKCIELAQMDQEEDDLGGLFQDDQYIEIPIQDLPNVTTNKSLDVASDQKPYQKKNMSEVILHIEDIIQQSPSSDCRETVNYAGNCEIDERAKTKQEADKLKIVCQDNDTFEYDVMSVEKDNYDEIDDEKQKQQSAMQVFDENVKIVDDTLEKTSAVNNKEELTEIREADDPNELKQRVEIQEDELKDNNNAYIAKLDQLEALTINPSSKLTKKVVPHVVAEQFCNVYDYMKKYILFHGDYAFIKCNDGMSLVIDYNFHSEQKCEEMKEEAVGESLYVISDKKIKANKKGYEWKTRDELYTAKQIESLFKISEKELPSSIKTFFMKDVKQNMNEIYSMLQNEKQRNKLLINNKRIPWGNRDKIPIFGKKSKSPLSLRLTKEEFVRRIRQFANNDNDNDTNNNDTNLIPIVTVNQYGQFTNEVLWIVRIGINIDIGISLKLQRNDKNHESLMILGIYLEFKDQHKLVPYEQHICKCLEHFICNIDDLKIGNEINPMKQKNKALQQKLNIAKEQIQTLQNLQKKHSIASISNAKKESEYERKELLLDPTDGNKTNDASELNLDVNEESDYECLAQQRYMKLLEDVKHNLEELKQKQNELELQQTETLLQELLQKQQELQQQLDSHQQIINSLQTSLYQ